MELLHTVEKQVSLLLVEHVRDGTLITHMYQIIQWRANMQIIAEVPMEIHVFGATRWIQWNGGSTAMFVVRFLHSLESKNSRKKWL